MTLERPHLSTESGLGLPKTKAGNNRQKASPAGPPNWLELEPGTCEERLRARVVQQKKGSGDLTALCNCLRSGCREDDGSWQEAGHKLHQGKFQLDSRKVSRNEGGQTLEQDPEEGGNFHPWRYSDLAGTLP